MKLNSVVAWRPLFIFILLTIGVLLLPSIAITWWYKVIQHMKFKVDDNAHTFRLGLLSKIDNTAKLLHPINSSATNLSRILSSSLNGTDLSRFDINLKVAPILFQAFSTIPHVLQVSYIGLEGSLFAYYRDNDKIFAMYSSKSNESMKYIWYKQLADEDTGKLYGDAIECQFYIMVNASWIQEALNSANGYASIGNQWSSGQDLLFLNSFSIHGKGVLSLGLSVKELINFFHGIDLLDGSLFLATQRGDVLKDGLPDTQMVVTGKSVSFNLKKSSGDQTDNVGVVSCMANSSMRRPSVLRIGETKYRIYCSPLEIMGVQSVYALAFPYYGLMAAVHRSTKIALILLMVMIVAVFISILSFVLLMVRAATREIHLCSALIKQMEATQQAERKSMNKSLIFASASHDIRAALAGITGLIQISYEEVSPGSDLEMNLQQMDDCAKDLVGLLNSILDTSKIEAGKMQVESEEFDLANLIEDAVDLFHPVGMRKGVEVVLDPCDGSLTRFSRVKGDRGKLKQVLCNLLSNAVKYTSEGHVTVRAWAQKPSLENKIIASNRSGSWKYCFGWFTENKESNNDVEEMNSVKKNPNCLEFLFEVDDTGKGIPKEKQKSVFENFVQVKETAFGQEGTGLGLGIVQSLVRLMGGEIAIIDKENNKKGTCFRFNIFLITTAGSTSLASNTRGDIEIRNISVSDSTNQDLGLTVRALAPSLPIRNSSPRLSILGSSPRSDESHVVLLIQNAERQKIVQKFMERLGIKVSAVNKWKSLHSTLTKIKQKQNVSPYSSSGKSDSGSRSEISSSRRKDIPLSALDGMEQGLPSNRSRSIIVRGASSFILLVIDATAGPFQQLFAAVTEFKRGLHRASCKVVWLDKPTMRNINPEGLEDDDILLKPFHGSRLFRVIRLLPEFGGNLQNGVSSAKPEKERSIRREKAVENPAPSSATHSHSQKEAVIPLSTGKSPCKGNMAAEGSSRREKHKKSKYLVGSSEIEEEYSNQSSSDKALCGLRFLVAEDNPFLRKIAMTNLSRLGASVELCQNGEEAVELVIIGLQGQRRNTTYSMPPYDYILMDCEMPMMNGYEATRQIRKEEASYDIHIPIIALTAHTSGDEGKKAKDAGMDFCLHKPLEREPLLEAIRCINNK
ncbi:histidine kinase CKI1 [Jatropha curcas]|uniref:histidine kinase CKI1 n=1 Tax=Jatropha curcas TaxID=180498 RepID=UPI0005FB78BE|nr:histidine kinase CKI1 [Jatropha curcas]